MKHDPPYFLFFAVYELALFICGGLIQSIRLMRISTPAVSWDYEVSCQARKV